MAALARASSGMKNSGEPRDAARISPGASAPPSNGVVDARWKDDFSREQIVDLKAAPPSRLGSSLDSSPPPAVRVEGCSESSALVPKKVYGRLAKNSPYIGFFHYAPSAGNRSRRTYFEKDIISTEVIRRQHEVRSNPMIGNFHYGHDLYGERFADFQRILAQLRARDEEREVKAVLDRHTLPFGGNLSPGSGAAVAARRHRGRARSITDSDSQNGKPMVRSSSAGKAAIMRVAAAEAAAAAAATALGSPAPSVGGSVVAAGAAVVLERGSCSVDGGGGGVGGGGTSVEWATPIRTSGQEALEDAGGSDCEVRASRRVSDAVREQVQRSFEGGPEDEGDDEDVDGAECLEKEARRRLRARAFAIVVYASGDSLVKLVEKERRTGSSTKRFKYAGAIDVSKCYPKSGSLDDCALLRPAVAERSRLYNDLIAEVNGFRRHFFLRQKMHPKEAYLQARRKHEAESSLAQNQLEVDEFLEDPGSIGWSRQASDSFANEPWLSGGGSSYSSMSGEYAAGGGGGAGGNGVGIAGDAGAGGPYLDPSWAGVRMVGVDDGVPPFHTLVGPAQFARLDRSSEEAQPGDAWMPGTVSALRTKESWRSKQEMRDFRKFKPFFVQAKTDFTATYRMLEDCLLGEGSYASVFLAEHLKRGEEVAVKAVQKRLLFSDMEKKSVGAEIDNQLRIVHKHVVRLYEVYETPDNVYIVLENCPCGDLEKMMYMRGRLTEIEAKRVTMQLLEALSYLHSKGIVHCDIKPQNLLFAPDPASPDAPTDKATESKSSERSQEAAGGVGGTSGGASRGQHARGKEQVTSPAGRLAKLCDFGISCKVPDVRFYKQTGDINKIPWSGLFGTGGYIAPEIMSQKPFGKTADLWSVGVMLYQMISGRLPFIPARVCVTKPVSFPATVWADVSVGVKELICGLLEKDPSQRLTAAQALQHPWIQTIHHLRPSFPHFVPKQGRCNSVGSSGGGGSGGGGEGGKEGEAGEASAASGRA